MDTLTHRERAYLDWLTSTVHWTPRGFRLTGDGARAPVWNREVVVGVSTFDVSEFARAAVLWAEVRPGWSVRNRRVHCACGLNIAKAGAHHHEAACVLAEPERRAAAAREALAFLDAVWADDPDWQAARAEDGQ